MSLPKQKSADCGDAERAQTEDDNLDGAPCEEVRRVSRSSDRHAEEDGYSVHKLVLSSLGKTVCNSADVEKVAEHEESDKGSGVWYEETYDIAQP